jgi:copper chaperone CopZ
MKTSKLALFGIAILALTAFAALAADDPAPAENKPQDAPHAAIFKVPALSEDLSKDFIKGLAKADGIISAKPDLEAGTFSVTYEPAKTDPKKIEAVLTQLASEVSLDKVQPADAVHAKSDCSKCPHHKTCGKKKD